MQPELARPAFIFATNADCEPESHRATKEAMLFPDGISIASSA